MISIQNVTKEFKLNLQDKRVRALDNLTLTVSAGEVFGFLGPNGAGKSTTIKILLNLIYPDKGNASIQDRDVRDPEARRFVGYLPENPYFYDYLTADELLAFGADSSGVSKSKQKPRISSLLETVNLTHARSRQLRTYSKGMVQRAGLALALVHDPAVVILDEPMSGLDPIGRKMVGDLIVDLKKQGKTVFFSSHILTDIERFCDRAGIIINGKLRRVDTIQNLLVGGPTLEEAFLKEVHAAGGRMDTL